MPGCFSPVFYYGRISGGILCRSVPSGKKEAGVILCGSAFLSLWFAALSLPARNTRFIVVCGIIIARQEYKIYQVNKELEATNQRVEELKKDKAELEAEKKRLDDLKYIEKLAREDHNMVGKDEVPLFIVDDKENGAEQKNKDAESKNR